MDLKFTITPSDKISGNKARIHIDHLTKPPGSLGRLESLAIQLAEMTANPFPDVEPPGVLVFAADHGISEEGVSAFPSDVTAQMAGNFSSGGAAINVFSRMIEAEMSIVDIGIKGSHVFQGVQHCKIREGTNNFLQEAAMTKLEAQQAITIGREAALKMIQSGVKCLIPGEMGIGNTTSSSALLAAITGKDIQSITGYGTGIEEERKIRKSRLIADALEKHQPDKEDALSLLSCVGGFEIAGMCGAILAAAEQRIPVLLDGFICTVSACLAVLISPYVREYLVAGHQSEEPGHLAALEWLGLEPLLKLQLRLGEGSGAALAYPLVKGAAKMLSEMATFQEAGISTN